MSISSRRLADLSPHDRRVLLAQLLKKQTGHAISSHALSYNQQGIWFLSQLAPESSVYNVNFAGRINTGLNVPAMRRAFQTLIDRHAVLRTTFPVHFGKPLQRVFETKEVHFREVDASTWSSFELRAQLLKEAYSRFDLERGPLLRVALFTRSAREHILLLVVHHIVIDFWSLSILLDELGGLYRAYSAGTKAHLPSLDLEYMDYVRWQAEMLESADGKRLSDYWQKHLAGDLPVLRLRTDRPRPPIPAYKGASHDFLLDANLSSALKTLAREQGATLYMVLLSAFDLLLSFYTGQDDLLVGSPMAGRSRAAFESIVGLFTNPVVLRADLSGNPTFQALLTQNRKTVLEALEHQDYPTVLLVERLRLPRDASRPPLCQVMFVLDKPHRIAQQEASGLDADDTGLSMNLAGLVLESLPLERRSATLDLVMLIIETPGSMAASIRYNTELFEAVTIAHMARQFVLVLDQIVQDPLSRLESLRHLLATAERQQAEGIRKDWRESHSRRLRLLNREARIPADCMHADRPL